MVLVVAGPVVAGQIAQLIEALAGLPGGDPDGWLGSELAEAVPVLVGLESQLAAVRLAAVAAADAAGVGQVTGFRSTADWLTVTTRMGHAGAMVATARALRDELPATMQALSDGAISEEHVRVIRRGHRMLGTDFARIEDTVVQAGSRCTVKDLRGLLDRIIQQYRPEDHDADTDTARAKRKVFLSRSLDGWWHLSGLLDPATGEKLKAAFDVYADKASDDDERLPSARRADALGEIAERAVAEIERVSGHGNLTLSMTQDQFDSGLGATWPSGSLMSRDEVTEHTCETDVAVVVRDGWQPINVGFAARFANRAQRIALAARDGDTCVHPGCSTQASRCIAHHIVHWGDGGASDLPNLVLVCRFHHERIHHGHLHILIEDGRYTTTRQPQPA